MTWSGSRTPSDLEHRLRPGESYRVRPGTRHRMVAITDCDILEASTPEVDDVVRLEDSFRSGAPPPARGELPREAGDEAPHGRDNRLRHPGGLHARGG